MLMPTSFASLLVSVIDILVLLIIIDIVISYLLYFRSGLSASNQFVQLVHRIVNPILAPVRRLIPPSKTGNMDFSGMIVIIILQTIARSL